MSKKKKLIPELRFSEFKNEGEWDKDVIDNLILTITPPKKLISSDYQETGEFPIIDQSKSYYCGWTNDSDALILKDFPVIIFGDHTCIIKLAKEPFAQGADGIKIIKPKELLETLFLYQYLQYNPVKQEEYKRHFSILKEKVVVFPNVESGEQQKVASCLSSLDEVIAAHSQKLDLLKDHKKGLMQNLFPQEGKKTPKYRFKEFEKDGVWVKKKLGDLGHFLGGGTPRRSNDDYWIGNIPWISSSDISEDDIHNISVTRFINDYAVKESATKKIPKGSVLFVSRVGVGKLAINKEELCTSQDFTSFLPKKGILNFFIGYYFSSNKNLLLSLNQGTSIKGFSKGDLENLKLPYPNNLKEQQKIAYCLSSLDEIITAQTEKIEQLKQHKKGLMQGLFPKIETI